MVWCGGWYGRDVSDFVGLDVSAESNVQRCGCVQHGLAVFLDDGHVQHDGRFGHVVDVFADIELLELRSGGGGSCGERGDGHSV